MYKHILVYVAVLELNQHGVDSQTVHAAEYI